MEAKTSKRGRVLKNATSLLFYIVDVHHHPQSAAGTEPAVQPMVVDDVVEMRDWGLE